MQVNRKYVFTVDQLELIRRLRNSGLTKDQVLTAFDSFERLDNQVGTSLNIPMTLQALQAQALQRFVLTVPGTVGMATNVLPMQDNQLLLQLQQLSKQQQQFSHQQQLSQQQFTQQQLSLVQLSQQQMSQQPLQQQHLPQQPLSQQPQLSQPAQQRQQLILLQQQLLQKLSQPVVVQSPPNLVPQHLPLSSNQPQQQHQLQEEAVMLKSISDPGNITDNSDNSEDRATEAGEEGEIDSDELKEFISQGEVACLEEIKDFILKHNVKQQQIAVLAGVSQPYVSRYLRADFNSMSDRSCRAIKKWYLAYRKNPVAIGPAANSALMMNSNSPSGSPTLKKLISQASIDLTTLASSPPAASSGGELDFLSCPRRERFVFRPNHLQILEGFFVEDNYPHYDRRDDIAKACNESTKELVGRELTEKEKVTVQIVSNWFANKRKDLKKLYKEEGLDASQFPMRSRGRPAHSYLDASSSTLLQSIFDHQNNPQVAHLLHMNGSHALHQPSAVSLVSETTTSSDATAPSFGVSRNSEAEEAAELQFSVEMAAVNQAIMSLTGQKPINIKMEKQDISEYLGARSRLNAVAADTS